jgi:hypothetical protein
MTRPKNKVAPAQAGAISPEEFKKLTPEEQLAKLNELQTANAEASAKLAGAEKAAKAARKDADKAGVVELPVIEDVEEDEDNEIEAGDYQFTAPTFTWDDGSVIKVTDLVANLSSKDKKVFEKAEFIVASLLQRKSGLLKRKED